MIRPFFESLVGKCDLLGVKVDLVPKTTVRCDGEDVAGFFDQHAGRIVVAAARPDWFTVLAHEFGHLVSPDLPSDPRATLEGLLSSRPGRSNLSRIRTAVRLIQLDELRAERVAVRMMRKFKVLPDTYIQRANAYLLEFEMTRRLGRASKATASEIPAIWQTLPKRLISPKQFGSIKDPGLFAECF